MEVISYIPRSWVEEPDDIGDFVLIPKSEAPQEGRK